MGLVKEKDVAAVARLPEIPGDDSDFEMEEGWDRINL
jgi:hypothetical protein